MCRFRSSQSDVWQTLRVVPRDSCSLTVHGLRSRTRYEFTVLARDELGGAHFSRVVNAMTSTMTQRPAKVTDDQHALLTLLGRSFHSQSTPVHIMPWLHVQLECGPMPNVMVALPNIGGAVCSTPQFG